MNILTSIVVGFLILLAAPSARSAEIIISTENTSTHFQTLHLQAYAVALDAAISEHNFKVIDSAKAFRGRDVAEAVSANRVGMAAPGLWHLGRFSPDLNALLLPSFMGLGAQETRKLVDGPFGASLNQGLESKLNIKIIGKWLDVGPAHIFTREKEVTSFDDLKGLRIRYAGGDANALRLKAMGAEPVLIPWPGVPDALDKAEIDGILSTSSTVASASLWKHGIRHAFLSHSYYAFYVPMISRDIWNRLTPPMHEKITGWWEKMIDDGRLMSVEHQRNALQTLQIHNIVIHKPTAQESAQERQELLLHQADFADQIGVSKQALEALETILGR
ncbi:TRAP transporter substrate-binding protein DctP [Thalassospira sp. MA62]|nr:TRAP transporter substrate-binding protein DctP [Thalassospira sp. MA62]